MVNQRMSPLRDAMDQRRTSPALADFSTGVLAGSIERHRVRVPAVNTHAKANAGQLVARILKAEGN